MSKRRPSPAMIIAVIALVLGLGGAAIAADLTKPQVKKIAKKVANKQIKKKAILKSQEGSLNVNSAKTADTAANAAAVNGVRVVGMDYRANYGDASAEVLNVPGLTIRVDCVTGPNDLEVIATVTTPGEFESGSTSGGAVENSLSGTNVPGDTFDLVDGDDNAIVGNTVFHGYNGDVVELTWAADDGNGDFDCVFAGTATSH